MPDIPSLLTGMAGAYLSVAFIGSLVALGMSAGQPDRDQTHPHLTRVGLILLIAVVCGAGGLLAHSWTA